jgi:hypothetical protein
MYVSSNELVSIKGFREYVESTRLNILWTWLCFRGHCNSSFKLISKLNREVLEAQKPISDVANIETNLLTDFECALQIDNLAGHINSLYKQDTLDTINWITRSQYQHLGLSTRLLDWSYRWDVALFFALYDPAQKHTDKDAEVWLLRLPQSLIMTNEAISNIQPTHVTSDFFFNHSISIN